MATFVRRQRKRQGFWMDRYHALSGLLWSQIFARTQSQRTLPNLITIGRLFKTKARACTHAYVRASAWWFHTHAPPHGSGKPGKQFASTINYWPLIEAYSSTQFRMKILFRRLDSGTGKEYERCPPPQYNSDQLSSSHGQVTLSWLGSIKNGQDNVYCDSTLVSWVSTVYLRSPNTH